MPNVNILPHLYYPLLYTHTNMIFMNHLTVKMQTLYPFTLKYFIQCLLPKNKGSLLHSYSIFVKTRKSILLWYYYSDFANCLDNAFFYNKQFLKINNSQTHVSLVPLIWKSSTTFFSPKIKFILHMVAYSITFYSQISQIFHFRLRMQCLKGERYSRIWYLSSPFISIQHP